MACAVRLYVLRAPCACTDHAQGATHARSKGSLGAPSQAPAAPAAPSPLAAGGGPACARAPTCATARARPPSRSQLALPMSVSRLTFGLQRAGGHSIYTTSMHPEDRRCSKRRLSSTEAQAKHAYHPSTATTCQRLGGIAHLAAAKSRVPKLLRTDRRPLHAAHNQGAKACRSCRSCRRSEAW